ncbi:hypothetical protein L9F63_016876, partial [Diploptera punctata]
ATFLICYRYVTACFMMFIHSCMILYFEFRALLLSFVKVSVNCCWYSCTSKVVCHHGRRMMKNGSSLLINCSLSCLWGEVVAFAWEVHLNLLTPPFHFLFYNPRRYIRNISI